VGKYFRRYLVPDAGDDSEYYIYQGSWCGNYGLRIKTNLPPDRQSAIPSLSLNKIYRSLNGSVWQLILLYSCLTVKIMKIDGFLFLDIT
jgi:hypothetical protein